MSKDNKELTSVLAKKNNVRTKPLNSEFSEILSKKYDIGRIQDYTKEETRRANRTPSEVRKESIDNQIKMMESRGMHKQAYDLRKLQDDARKKQAGVDKQKEGITGFFNPYFEGIGDVASGLGSAVNYANKSLGTDIFSGTAKKMKEFGEETHENFRDLEYEQKIGDFDWGDLKHPEYYSHTILRGLPFALSLMPVGAMLTAGGAAVGTAAGASGAASLGLGEFGTIAMQVLGKTAGGVAGAALNRTIESATEAGQTYDEILKKTGSEDAAKKAGDSVFKNNMKLAGMDAAEMALLLVPGNKLPFFKSSKLFKSGVGKAAGYGAKMVAGGAMEGTEEILQKKFQDDATGRDFKLSDPETMGAGVAGALMGMSMSGAGDVYLGFQQKVESRMNEKAKADYKEEVDKLVTKGVEAKVARQMAFNKTTEKNKGVISVLANQEIQNIIKEDKQKQEQKIQDGTKIRVREAGEKSIPITDKNAPLVQQNLPEGGGEAGPIDQGISETEKTKEIKKPKLYKKSLKTTESIDKFLADNYESLDEKTTDDLFKLQDLLYNKYLNKEKDIATKDAGGTIFDDAEAGFELGEQYNKFKQEVKHLNRDKIETMDADGFTKYIQERTGKSELNIFDSGKFDSDELRNSFVDRLVEERYGDKKSESNIKFSMLDSDIKDLQEKIENKIKGIEQESKADTADALDAIEAMGKEEKTIISEKVDKEEGMVYDGNEGKEAIIVDPDLLKEAAYESGDKTAYDPKNHEKFSKEAKERLSKLLKTVKNKIVKMTAGGSGSGKSELVISRIQDDFDGIIVDGTLSDYESVKKKIKQIEDAGKEVRIYAVLPRIESAWKFVQKRKLKSGRGVPLDVFIDKHTGFIDTLDKLIRDGVPVFLKDTRGVFSKTEAKYMPFMESSKEALKTLKEVKELYYNLDKDLLNKKLKNVKLSEKTRRKVLAEIEFKRRGIQEGGTSSEQKGKGQQRAGKDEHKVDGGLRTNLKETPKTSQKEKPQEARSEVKKSKATDGIKKGSEKTELATEKPVRVKGKTKLSRYAQRMADSLMIENTNPDYKEVNAKNDSEAGMKYASENWEDAKSIALNLKENTTGIRTTTIRSAVEAIAHFEGDTALQAEVFNRKSRALTRHGQEIEAAKYQFYPNSGEAYAREVLKVRRAMAGETRIVEDGSGKSKVVNNKDKTNSRKKDLKEFVDKSVKKNTKASDILNSLMC